MEKAQTQYARVLPSDVPRGRVLARVELGGLRAEDARTPVLDGAPELLGRLPDDLGEVQG